MRRALVQPHARPGRAVGGADPAGVPCRGPAPRARRERRGAGRGHRRRVAGGGGGGTVRVVEALRGEPQGHHGRWTCAWPRPSCARGADRLPRPSPSRRGGRHRRAVLHRRQRGALPRGGRGARDRGAGRVRARPPLRPRRSTSGATPGTGTGPRDDLDDYCELRARGHRPAARASRPTSCPGARTGWPTSWTGARGTTWWGRSTSCATRRWTCAEPRAGRRGTSGARATPSRVWRSYFETLGEAARCGLFDILAHPDLVKVWGEARARARGRPAPLLRAGHGRDRGVRRGHRGVHRRAAQAGGRDLPGRGLPRDVPRGGPARGAVERRPRARYLGHEYERAVDWLAGPRA